MAKIGGIHPHPRAPRFSHGDELQGIMAKVQTAGEASHPLSLSHLPLSANFHRKRDVWVRGRIG